MNKRDDFIEAMQAAWEKHAQPVSVQIPAGCGCFVTRGEDFVMGKAGFKLAVSDLFKKLIGEQP